MQLERHGAERLAGVLSGSEAGALIQALSSTREGGPGKRINHLRTIGNWAGPSGPIGLIAMEFRGSHARAVRAILFDKHRSRNWALGWHQDRTIAVAARVDVAGFGPWTVKRGMVHVEPPIALLEKMLTIRVHLDSVTSENAPLKVSPGTHRLGRIPQERIEAVVAAHGQETCLAALGDVWVYATPILHASDRSDETGRRRVLQIDYCADDLPAPLRWQFGT